MSEENITSVDCVDVITAQEPIIHLTENGVEGFEIVCRLCANRSEHLIPIYSEEGITNDLADKMNLYLPIQVSKNDLLPLQCCFQCASTVLTWHELVIASVEADRRLREIQSEVEKQIAVQAAEPGPSQIQFIDVRCTTSLNLLNDTNRTELDQKESKAIHQCTICFKQFHQKTSLQRHIRVHNDERPFTCDICGKGFRDKSALTRHIRHVHIRTKDFSCDLCRKTFASAATRDDHRRSHTKECPFICQTCGKCFGRKASLYIHSKIHTDIFPFSCTCCDKKFRRRQELLNHVSTHSGEKQFCCLYCGKSFRLKSSLLTHNLVHNNEKPFSCKICGISYRQVRYLRKHILKHGNNKNTTD